MVRYEFIICVFVAFVYFTFLSFFIEREISLKESLLVYTIFFCGMFLFRIYCESIILFMVLSIGSITVFCVRYGVRVKKALLLGIFVTFINILSEIICSGLMVITYNQTMREIEKNTSLYVTGTFVSKLIFFALLRCIVRIFKKHDRTLPKIQWYGVMSLPAISIFAANVTEHFIFTHGTYAFVFLDGLTVINMVSFVLYDELAKRSKIMIEKEQDNLRLEAENNRYNAMIAYIDETHSYMHDIQGHLRNILSLAETEKYNEIAAYIRKLDIKVTEMYENSILPQYPAVDSVLRQKAVHARKRGITMESNITVPANMPIDPIDLCIILGNALDNAIEACLKMCGDKKICLEMFLTKNRLIIKITNPSKPTQIENDKCSTTKSDTSKHGYGLSNIRNTIEKYSGNMMLRFSDGYFFMIALILF